MDKERTQQITEMMEYITERAFPNSSYNERKAVNGRQEIIQNVAQFREQLKQKSDEEIKKIYSEEKQKELQLRQYEENCREQKRFFNQTGAQANLEEAIKLPYWTIDEAITYSLNKNPIIVNCESIKPYVNKSPFVQEYIRRKDLVVRAIEIGDLQYHSSYSAPAIKFKPSKFISWAINIFSNIPEELEKTLTHINWESRSIENEKQIADLNDQIKFLKEKLKQYEKSLDPKREATYQKIIYAYVVVPTKFNAEAKRNSATTTIISKIEQAGFTIDKEALLAVLRDSSECYENLIILNKN